MRRLHHGVDVATRVGSLELPNPIMTAAGTFGSGDEVARLVDASALGAVVAKSVSLQPWPGNPGPRLAPAGGGMLNAVGLQNPGVDAWIADYLPRLRYCGVRVVASVYGGAVDDYRRLAAALAPVAGSGDVIAVEANLSCPNREHGAEMFAHSEQAIGDVIGAIVAELGGAAPIWAKLSPNVPTVAPFAVAAAAAGAEAVVVTNTLIGMKIDIAKRTPAIANVTAGLSGRPLRPVALRAAFECRRALDDAGRGDVAVVGVGGVSTADHVLEFLMAGACAVQVGTAHFADPAASVKLVKRLPAALAGVGARSVAEIIGCVRG